MSAAASGASATAGGGDRDLSAAASSCHCANSAALHTEGCAEGGAAWPACTRALPAFRPVPPITASLLPPLSTSAALPACRFHLKAGEGGANHTTDEPPATLRVADGASPSECARLPSLPPPPPLLPEPGAGMEPGTWMCRAGGARRKPGGSRWAASSAVRSSRARRRASSATSATLALLGTCGCLSAAAAAPTTAANVGDGAALPAASPCCSGTVTEERWSGDASRPPSKAPCSRGTAGQKMRAGFNQAASKRNLQKSAAQRSSAKMAKGRTEQSGGWQRACLQAQ